MLILGRCIRQMEANAQAIRCLLDAIPAEQAAWKPNEENWSLCQVMEHLYNEERIDFRLHLREMFHQPPLAWGGFPAEEYQYLSVIGLREGLDGFLKERQASLAWLESLQNPDWDRTSTARFGLEEVISLSAGEVMASWLAHDFLHIRQINELLYAWTEAASAPVSLRYAGGW